MRGLPYYEEPEYHKYLLSAARAELFPPTQILSQLNWQGVKNVLDFGMGNGYFLTHFYRHAEPETHIWGAECQEILIDYCLKLKVKEKFENFIPFFIERTEHPLLPDWIPPMDLIFCSCSLSTFADPALAIQGIGRALNMDGRIIILDWEKTQSPSGPDIVQKISQIRMKYFVEDAGFRIIRQLKTNQYLYAMEIGKDPDKEHEEVQPQLNY